MMRRVVYMIILVLGGHIPGMMTVMTAQDPRVERAPAIDLEGTMISDILADRQGNLWLTTESGLRRYDGYQATSVYPMRTQAETIGINLTRVVHEDDHGTLWVGSANFIFSYDPRTESFTRHEYFHLLAPDRDTTLDGGIFQHVRTIASDPSGRVYFGLIPGYLGTCSQRLVYFDPQDSLMKVWEDGSGPVMRNVYLSTRDRVGNAWFISTEGVYVMREGFRLQQIRLDLQDYEQGLFTGIAVQEDEGIWLTKQGVLIYLSFADSTTQVWKHPMIARNRIELDQDNVIDLQLDRKGNVWMGVNEGLLRFEGATNHFELIQIDTRDDSGSPVNSLCLDHFDNLWVGTQSLGLFRWTGDHDFRGLSSDILKVEWPPLAPLAGGQIWMGIGSDGLHNIFDLHSGQLRRLSLWPHAAARGMLGEYAPGRSVLICSAGIRCMDHGTFAFDWCLPGMPSADSSYILMVKSDPEHRIWVGTSRGLFILDANGERLRHVMFEENRKYPVYASNWVNNIYFDEEYGAWLTTSNGLFTYCYDTGVFERHGSDSLQGQTFPGRMINAFWRDDDGTVWVGMWESGLSCYHPENGVIKSYTVEDGLPNNSVQGILPDPAHGVLWLSTFGGISRFDIDAGEFHNFDARDGIQGMLHTDNMCMIAENGQYFFSGRSGITYFHPDSIESFANPPKLHFTDFKILNAKQPPGASMQLLNRVSDHEEIVLTYNQNDITIGYIGIQYDEPSRNQYKYTLENYSKTWYEVGGQRSATFVSLPPGRYVFRVRAANSHGVWTKEALTAVIRVLPPWWATYWAYALYAIVAAAAGWGTLRIYRSETIRKERERARDALDEAKTQFFTNVSHELRTPLTIIAGMTDAAGTDPKARDLIKRNTEILRNLVDQILDLRKLESGTLALHEIQGDLVSYLRYLCEAFEAQAQLKGIRFACTMPERLVMDYDPEKMMRMIGNLLSNAIKFTPGGGQIHLRVVPQSSSGRESVVILVQDSGIGMPSEKLPHIFKPFYQIDHRAVSRTPESNGSTVSDAYWSSGAGGTGIGLAIVREYLALMGGEVTVESEVGKGSTFRVVLPVHHLAPFAVGTPVGANTVDIEFQNDHHTSGNGYQPLVLIVEDNPDVIVYLRHCLGHAFRIRTAFNGREGIDAARDQMPDVVICDVMMPEMGGLEFCRILKGDIRTSHVPVIMLTAKAEQEARLEGLAAGADAYLVKPFLEEELLIRLSALIALREKMRQRYAALTVPDVPEPELVQEDAFIVRLRSCILEHLDDASFNVQVLSRNLGMSERQLQLKVKALTGKTPVYVIRTLRLEKACELLDRSDLRISEIAYDSGFSDPDYFTRVFVREHGMTPTEWRERRRAHVPESGA